MSRVTSLTCVQCRREFSAGQADTCPVCGPQEGILDVHVDLAAAARGMNRAVLTERPASIWRYQELLPVDPPPPAGLQTVGWTPLFDAPRLAQALGIARLRLKDDGRSASGSFKDRASAVGVCRALAAGASAVACASTGNAASSLAYCAAAVGLPANIFVSQVVPQGKLAQLLAYGARVFKIRGSYAQAYDLCTQACGEFGWYNRNAATNPYLVEGKKTAGLEIAEQCADDPPDWVCCSVGDGCSIAGVHKGLQQMRAVGVIDWSARLLGVQAAGVAPIARAFIEDRVDLGAGGDTYADSINVPVPRNWRKAVTAVRESNGTYVVASEEQIREAVRCTGRLAAVFAEPAAAAAVAGIAVARRQGVLTPTASVVAIITGNGLKDIQGACSALGDPHELDPDFEHIKALVDREANAGVPR